LTVAPSAATAGVYASAHWCGPCRQFTPQLAKFYSDAKARGRPFEIVFASADRDEASMLDYYTSQPWLAIPFDAEEREAFMAAQQVRSIPRLIIFGPGGNVSDGDGG
jgi:nucleoredoxin